YFVGVLLERLVRRDRVDSGADLVEQRIAEVARGVAPVLLIESVFSGAFASPPVAHVALEGLHVLAAEVVRVHRPRWRDRGSISAGDEREVVIAEGREFGRS